MRQRLERKERLRIKIERMRKEMEEAYGEENEGK